MHSGQQFEIFFKPSAPGCARRCCTLRPTIHCILDFSFTVRGVSLAPFNDLIVQTFGSSPFPVTTAGNGDQQTTIPVVVQNFGNAPIPSVTPTTDIEVQIQNTADTTSSPITIGTISNVKLSGLCRQSSTER